MLFNGTELSTDGFSLHGPGQQHTEIVAVDYKNGIIELADPVLVESFIPGQVAIVAPDSFADSFTMQERLDAGRFSVGEEDLRVGGGPIKEVVAEENRIDTSVVPWHIQPGMMVLNGLMEPVGRVADEEELIIAPGDRGSLSIEDFPKAAGDASRRFFVVMAAPGDTILIPILVTYERQ